MRRDPGDRPFASPQAVPSRGETAPFRAALRFWLKLGCISFGGPAGQIAILHEELVVRRRWIEEKCFQHALGYCMALPGPEAQQLATYCGWLLHGRWGGLAAGVLFVLPSFFILGLLAHLSLAFGQSPTWEAASYGLRCAVVALLGHALWRMGRRAWQSPWHIGVGLATFAATYFAGFPFPAVLVIAMLLGFVLPESKSALAPPNEQGAAGGVAESGVEVESRAPRLADTLRTAGIFAGLFAFSFSGLMLAAGWDHVLTQLAWFFTQCAWLTFGGAYAVLPFVMENAVNQYGWLSMNQMMHGLALGESTPGPLIMVVTYVGYVAGMQAPLAEAFALGALGVVSGPVVLAWLGAAVATWFTFLPSFFFIFAGAPWIEASHGMPFLTRPLRFVSAAVIGPMAALALVFAHHAFWPESRAGGFDAVAAGLSVSLAALLGHRRMTVPWVILLGALTGFAISALRG